MSSKKNSCILSFILFYGVWSGVGNICIEKNINIGGNLFIICRFWSFKEPLRRTSSSGRNSLHFFFFNPQISYQFFICIELVGEFQVCRRQFSKTGLTKYVMHKAHTLNFIAQYNTDQISFRDYQRVNFLSKYQQISQNQ